MCSCLENDTRLRIKRNVFLMLYRKLLASSHVTRPRHARNTDADWSDDECQDRSRTPRLIYDILKKLDNNKHRTGGVTKR